MFVPPFGRLFLRDTRREVEVRQYAESLFLKRELFATRQRTAVLVLISLFERRIEILADTGLRGRIAEPDWHGVIARMTPVLKRGEAAGALREGLSALEALLTDRGFTAAGGGSQRTARSADRGGWRMTRSLRALALAALAACLSGVGIAIGASTSPT